MTNIEWGILSDSAFGEIYYESMGTQPFKKQSPNVSSVPLQFRQPPDVIDIGKNKDPLICDNSPRVNTINSSVQKLILLSNYLFISNTQYSQPPKQRSYFALYRIYIQDISFILFYLIFRFAISDCRNLHRIEMRRKKTAEFSSSESLCQRL